MSKMNKIESDKIYSLDKQIQAKESISCRIYSYREKIIDSLFCHILKTQSLEL